jgi:hypothetical protein
MWNSPISSALPDLLTRPEMANALEPPTGEPASSAYSEALRGVAEERIEDGARRSSRDELGDDHLRGLLHRSEPEERDQAIHREHRLGREELDGATEQAQERGRPALRRSGVEAVAVRLEPPPGVGTKLRLVTVEATREGQRAHRAIDGAREAAVAEHREELAARGSKHEMNLHEPIGGVHEAACPRRLGHVLRVDGRIAELVALDANLAPRSRQLHRSSIPRTRCGASAIVRGQRARLTGPPPLRP